MRTELPLHDASFDGVVLRGKSAELYFSTTDGNVRVVRLSGIDAMHIEDFREGNIVVLFETVSAELPRNHIDWDRLYPSPHPAAAEKYYHKYEEFVRAKRSSIEEGRLTFVQMMPALGADLLAVCEDVQMDR